MQQSTCELLVHITAPGTVKNDQRFSAIAQSILEFHPITRFGSSWHSDSPLSTPCSPGATKHQSSGVELMSSLRRAHGRDRHSTPSATSVATDQSLQTTSLSWLLPPYPPGLDVEGLRPRTAPELKYFGTEPPITASHQKHRRSHSETSSFCHSLSAIPNSYGQEQDMRPHTNDFTSNRPRMSGDLCLSRVFPTPTRERPPNKRRRVGKRSTIESQQESLSEASMNGTRILSSLHDPMELTDSLQSENFASNLQSFSSTVSPSQPIRLRGATPAEVPPSLGESNVVLFMDLTRETPEQASEALYRSTRSTHKWPGPERCHSAAGSHSSNRRERLGDKLFTDEVASPPSTVGELVFTTHVTRTLQAIVDRIPMDKVYRPRRVLRPVRALERGHWLFNVLVVRDHVVAASRRAAGNSENLEGLGGEVDIGRRKGHWTRADRPGRATAMESEIALGQRCPAWTEAEFQDFWRNMSRLVRQGKCGWGCRLVKEADHEASTETGQMWRITMFCWGEVVGHVWLALWILSDKLTAQTPMQWISGDGSVVIEMSGEKVSRTSGPEMASMG